MLQLALLRPITARPDGSASSGQRSSRRNKLASGRDAASLSHHICNRVDVDLVDPCLDRPDADVRRDRCRNADRRGASSVEKAFD